MINASPRYDAIDETRENLVTQARGLGFPDRQMRDFYGELIHAHGRTAAIKLFGEAVRILDGLSQDVVHQTYSEYVSFRKKLGDRADHLFVLLERFLRENLEVAPSPGPVEPPERGSVKGQILWRILGLDK